MLYLLIGSDISRRQEAQKKLLKTTPTSEILRFDDLSFDLDSFNNLISSEDLFGQEKVIILDQVLNSPFLESIISKVSDIAESKNKFIFIENSLSKANQDIFEKQAEEFQVFDKVKEKDNKFNIFSITDAFGARDKKNTWVLLQKALRAGLLAEDVLNVLIWQAKNLCLVKGEKDIKKTGLSPFVFNKGRRYSENWSTGELEKLSSGLVTLFHESHLGLELEPNLELFLLKSL